MTSPPRGERAKALGAYYTDSAIAAFLVRWALRNRNDLVLDPSFGGGVFLQASSCHLQALGGSGTSVYGVEVDDAAFKAAEARHGGVTLLHADFFALSPEALPRMDAVVGNPPFVRYQRFRGAARARALARARQHGVALSPLASSWAAFVVHSSAFLKPGGRLALVVPAELVYADYARAVLDHLRSGYGRLTLIGFRERPFRGLDQETILLLADQYGETCSDVHWHELASPAALAGLEPATLAHERPCDLAPLVKGEERLSSFLISPEASALYRDLAQRDIARPLGTYARVTSGYASGANRFFQLSPARAAALELPPNALRPAVFSSRAFTSTRFARDDWERASRAGLAGYVLHVPDEPLEPSLARYLNEGKEAGVHLAYRCRIRTPWYRVPRVQAGDAMLSALSVTPRFAANRCSAAASNALHLVQLSPMSPYAAEALSALWLTSLTRLSCELEGRPRGGGVLKLEPSAARRILLPTIPLLEEGLAKELEQLCRADHRQRAEQLADEAILQAGLGLSAREVALLREAAADLAARRKQRGRGAQASRSR
jgi:adenine-specific DNA methylase